MTRWWPLLALVALLLAFTATMANSLGPGLMRPAAKDAYLDAPPRLDAVSAVVAPLPTSTPDPASFAPKIEIVLPPPSPPAKGGGGVTLNKADAAEFCANINGQREANGVPALSKCFATSARQEHANAMAATSPVAIWHQGDNIVGVAPSQAQLIAAFMDSPPHQEQILTASYTGARVGCAWGQASGMSKPHIYCTADFY
jgi:uncharacterized protein YkwD